MIINWGKVNSNLKWLIKADENPYFNLMQFCNDKNLNYRDVLCFINIGRSIISRDLDISYELKSSLKQYEEIINQLELVTI